MRRVAVGLACCVIAIVAMAGALRMQRHASPAWKQFSIAPAFAWDEDRVTSVTATLRDRFGLRLSPGRRDIEALIVDRIRRDPALVLFDGIGRVTRAAPAGVRHWIADVLIVR